MKNNANNAFMENLAELLHPSPSSVAKLLAAWNGLSLESQILILAEKKRLPGPPHLYQKLIEKALTSPNAFIRYLAARDIKLNDDNDHSRCLANLIEGDPEPLVKYALLETSGPDFPSECQAKTFFDLTHEGRLAVSRALTGEGEEVAKLITYAIDNLLVNGKVSEIELFDILCDYLDKQKSAGFYSGDDYTYDGLYEHSLGKDIDTLWELVPKAPAIISDLLIEKLPESAGLSCGIPSFVIDGLTERQLAKLLHRSDIRLEDLRKRMFMDALEKADENRFSMSSVLLAAVSHSFHLSNSEFADILKENKQTQLVVFESLSMSARDLRLCVYQAMHDALMTSEVSYSYAKRAITRYKNRLNYIHGSQRRKELRELRLYMLAVAAAPWKIDDEGDPPEENLAFLRQAVVRGDPWATFVAFSREWDDSWNAVVNRTKSLEKFLPRIAEVDVEDILLLEEDIEDVGELADRVSNKLTALLATVRGAPKDDEYKLARALGELAAHASVAQERSLESLNSTRVELVKLRKAVSRQRLLLFIAIGLLTLLFVAGM